jgi:hypothetical protein
MKRIGLAAVLLIALISCNGGANDAKLSTDTTTFPSEQKPASDAKSLGEGTDTTERTPGKYGATPGTPSSARTSTPGNQGRDTVRQ